MQPDLDDLEVIAEALRIIDETLGDNRHNEIVSAVEIRDVLLDLRLTISKLTRSNT